MKKGLAVLMIFAFMVTFVSVTPIYAADDFADTPIDSMGDWFATLGKDTEAKKKILAERKAVRKKKHAERKAAIMKKNAEKKAGAMKKEAGKKGDEMKKKMGLS